MIQVRAVPKISALVPFLRIPRGRPQTVRLNFDVTEPEMAPMYGGHREALARPDWAPIALVQQI